MPVFVGCARNRRARVDGRKQIPYETKLPVSLAHHEVELIRDRTLAPPSPLALGLAEGDRVTFQWSLGDIEELHGYVAAAANHAGDRALQRKLDKVWTYLQSFLDTYDDQAELP